MKKAEIISVTNGAVVQYVEYDTESIEPRIFGIEHTFIKDGKIILRVILLNVVIKYK